MCSTKVPSRIKMNSEMSLMEFFEDVPALGFLGTPYLIEPNAPYIVNEEVQLVCKYLRAYKIGGTKGINKLYKEGMYACAFMHRPWCVCVGGGTLCL